MCWSKTEAKEKCQYSDINECPYNSRRECPQVRKNCHLPNDGDSDHVTHHSFWKPIVLAIIAIVVLVIVQFSDPKNEFWESIFSWHESALQRRCLLAHLDAQALRLVTIV